MRAHGDPTHKILATPGDDWNQEKQIRSQKSTRVTAHTLVLGNQTINNHARPETQGQTVSDEI